MARFELTPESVQIVVLPVFRDRDQWTDFISRAAWYLGKSSFKEIVVFVTDASLADQRWEIGSEFSEDLQEVIEVLGLRMRVVVQPTETQIRAEVQNARIILQLEEPETAIEWSEDELQGKRVIVADRLKTRQEGGAWNQLNYVLRRDFFHEVIACQERFRDLLTRLGKFPRAYAIASGPSIADYPKFDYSDSLVVVCNSVIFDEDLMQHIRPQILVFADPIFHFGPSQYAGEFRRRLRSVAASHDFSIIIPEKYFGLFTDWFPELRSRTIAIPLGDKDGKPNLNLIRRFEVRPSPNVLTMLMLPVASTFADEVQIIGCDGRPAAENSYFWSHHPKVQIGDKMQNIQRVHPAFFAIDYDDYYSEHCAYLDQLLSLGENEGKRYRSITFSHIPALNSRENLLPRVLVLDPSPIHGRSATGQLKTDLFQRWNNANYLQVGPRSSSDGTRFKVWNMDAPFPMPPEGITSRQAIAEIANFDPEVIYIRPTDEPIEFLNFVKLVLSETKAPYVFHLMDDWPERAKRNHPDRFDEIDACIRELLANADGRLSIGQEMSDAFSERYQVDLIPISNGVSSEVWMEDSGHKPDPNVLVLRYCGALAADMTLKAIERVVTAVSTLSTDHPIRMELYVLQSFFDEANSRFAELPGVTVLKAVEDRSAYRSLLQSAGALVIGYNFDDASIRYTRYSVANKLPECLAAGRPLLVHGPSECATVSRAKSLTTPLVVDSESPERVQQALLDLLNHRSEFEKEALEIRDRTFQEFSLEASRSKLEGVLTQAASRNLTASNPCRKDVLTSTWHRFNQVTVSELEILLNLFPSTVANPTLVRVGSFEGIRRKLLPRNWNLIELDFPILSSSGTPSPETSSTLLNAEVLAFGCHEEVDKLFQTIDWDSCRASVIFTTCDNDKTQPLGYVSRNLAKNLVTAGFINFVSEWHKPLKPGLPKTSWRHLLVRPLHGSEKSLFGIGIAVSKNFPTIRTAGKPKRQQIIDTLSHEFEFCAK